MLVPRLSDRSPSTESQSSLNAVIPPDDLDFRDLLESIPVGIAIAEIDQARVFAVNSAFLHLTGLGESDVLDQSLNDLLELPSNRSEAVSTGGIEALLRAQEGTGRAVLWTLAPLDAGDRQVIVHSFVDISSQKQDNQRLRELARDLATQQEHDLQIQKQLRLMVREISEAKRKADCANEAKSQFLANVSHEIRTPLNGVIGMANLCLETKLTDEQREYLELVLSSATNLLSVINDLLDFSKIEAGQMLIEATELPLRETIEAALAPLGVRAAGKQLQLIWSPSPDVADARIGDPLRLQQVLVNLVGNALKFTETGWVEVRMEQVVRDGSALVSFAVADTGIGIPADRQAAVFESFTQADGSTSRKYGGTGLGLSITRQLVALMGGTVRLESPGNSCSIGGPGTTFFVELPLPVDDKSEAGVLDRSIRLDGKRALIVGEQYHMLAGLMKTLESWSVDVEYVNPAVAGDLDLDTAGEYDLVIIDTDTGESDGFAVATGLSSPHRNRMVLLSGAYRAGDSARASELGALFVHKPIRFARLLPQLLNLFAAPGALAGSPDRVDAEAAFALPPLHILVAEDNEINQVVARRLLERHGHTVDIAADGAKAVELAKGSSYDVILMDMNLPVMSGVEAVRAIREWEATSGFATAILAMSAHVGDEHKRQALEAGMNGAVGKPFTPEQLFGTIGDVLGLTTMPVLSENWTVPESRQAAAYDREAALRNVGGDENLAAELVGIFAGQRDEYIAAIDAALAERESEALRQASHRLKGALGTVGACAAREIAAAIERLAETNSVDECVPLAEQLKSTVAAFEHAVDTYVNKPAPSGIA